MINLSSSCFSLQLPGGQRSLCSRKGEIHKKSFPLCVCMCARWMQDYLYACVLSVSLGAWLSMCLFERLLTPSLTWEMLLKSDGGQWDQRSPFSQSFVIDCERTSCKCQVSPFFILLRMSNPKLQSNWSSNSNLTITDYLHAFTFLCWAVKWKTSGTKELLQHWND